jgi:hypothetical protein
LTRRSVAPRAPAGHLRVANADPGEAAELFMDLEADLTGAQIRVTETHFDVVRDGKIVEHGGDWDQSGLMQQMGAMPAPD